MQTKSVHRMSVLPFGILLSSLVIEWRIIRCDLRSFIVCLESIKEAKCEFVCKVLGETESAKIVHTIVLLGKLSCVTIGVNTKGGGWAMLASGEEEGALARDELSTAFHV